MNLDRQDEDDSSYIDDKDVERRTALRSNTQELTEKEREEGSMAGRELGRLRFDGMVDTCWDEPGMNHIGGRGSDD